MAEEYPCLEGEDEYLEDSDHQSDCGTQLDGDDILYAHESYNYTQIDDADEEGARTSSTSDNGHTERLIPEDVKFTRILGNFRNFAVLICFPLVSCQLFDLESTQSTPISLISQSRKRREASASLTLTLRAVMMPLLQHIVPASVTNQLHQKVKY